MGPRTWADCVFLGLCLVAAGLWGMFIGMIAHEYQLLALTAAGVYFLDKRRRRRDP
jgi:hypothetical protein